MTKIEILDVLNKYRLIRLAIKNAYVISLYKDNDLKIQGDFDIKITRILYNDDMEVKLDGNGYLHTNFKYKIDEDTIVTVNFIFT